MGRLALPLLILAAAAFPGDDRPDRRADPDLQPRINAAIAKGIEHLKSIQRPDGSWPYAASPDADDTTGGMTALALYALAASKVLPDDPAIRKGVRWTELHKAPYSPSASYSTYSASLLVLALTRIEPKLHRDRIHRLAESIAVGELATDQWTYRLGSGRTKDAERDGAEGLRVLQRGDNSNSQFAVLALWAASALAGYQVPTHTWQRIQGFYGRTQLPSGGWGYTPRQAETASMTSAGLCSYVYATAGLLGGVAALPAARKDPVAQRGLDALLSHLHPPDYANYYFVYALERAGTVMAIPEEDWYVQGARALVQRQDPGGRWGPMGKAGGGYETSLALLFLSQATRAAVTRGGDPHGGRRITEFPTRVGPGQLEEALLYYVTAPAAERRALAPRFAEARAAAVGFLVGKLRASDRGARAAAYELLEALVERRFLFDPDGEPEERDVMLVPIEGFWKEQGQRLVWDDAKGRFAVP
jgi:hypothetical protein